MAFPTGHYQTEQAKNASNGHTSQGKSQSRAKPEGDQEGKAKKENGGETGHPHIHGGDPTPALPPSGAGAVAQSKREQNHAGKGEENKKQQREKDDRHPLMLARVRAGLALIRDQRSEVSGRDHAVAINFSVAKPISWIAPPKIIPRLWRFRRCSG